MSNGQAGDPVLLPVFLVDLDHSAPAKRRAHEPGDGVFVVLPMFWFVSIGNLGQSRLSHEHVGVDDDEEEGEAAQANLEGKRKVKRSKALKFYW